MTRKYQVLVAIGAMACFTVLANVYFRTEPAPQTTGPAPQTTEPALQTMGAEVATLLEERRRLDETVWAQEVAAQKHEETIVKYWDQMLRPEDDKYAVLAEFPFQTITLDEPGESTELDWGIKRTTFRGQGKTFDQAGWRQFLRDMEDRGYDIKAVEFHQSSYDVDSDGNAVSVFSVF